MLCLIQFTGKSSHTPELTFVGLQLLCLNKALLGNARVGTEFKTRQTLYCGKIFKFLHPHCEVFNLNIKAS